MISNYILAVLSASTGVLAVTGKFEVRYPEEYIHEKMC